MKIGITGATGQLGRLVVENLKKRIDANELVALVRSVEKAADLGVEARNFDYVNAEQQSSALDGVDILLLISGNEIGQRTLQHTNVIEAAKKAKVKHIVYTSILRADTSTISLAGEHWATEKALSASGIAYTILRNGWYTENYTGSIAGALQGGAFIGSAADGKISSAARADFAEAAAIVLTTPALQGKVYELAGDEAYTLSDLAAEISKQTGKDISYTNLPEAEYAHILSGFGIPEGFAKAIAGWDVSASENQLYDSSQQLSKLLGRPTTPLAAVVAVELSKLK